MQKEPQDERVISVTKEEYSRMLRENQLMIGLLDRLMDIAVLDGQHTEDFARHGGLIMAIGEAVDKIKNPVMQIPDRKTGLTPYERMLSSSAKSSAKVFGIPVYINPDMPEDQIWCSEAGHKIIVEKGKCFEKTDIKATEA